MGKKTKRICPVCGGRGYLIFWSFPFHNMHICFKCLGKGEIEVDE